MTTKPSIKKNKFGVSTLYVDGNPFLMRAGELHNSSASSLAYMEQEVWPNLRELHLNTVLLSLAWEDLEPEEGHYDDTLLAGLVEQARREKLRLILLWFGLWKNGESFYVPGWVKSDSERFFRARYNSGAASNTVSPLCSAAVEKDRAARHQRNHAGTKTGDAQKQSRRIVKSVNARSLKTPGDFLCRNEYPRQAAERGIYMVRYRPSCAGFLLL